MNTPGKDEGSGNRGGSDTNDSGDDAQAEENEEERDGRSAGVRSAHGEDSDDAENGNVLGPGTNLENFFDPTDEPPVTPPPTPQPQIEIPAGTDTGADAFLEEVKSAESSNKRPSPKHSQKVPVWEKLHGLANARKSEKKKMIDQAASARKK